MFSRKILQYLYILIVFWNGKNMSLDFLSLPQRQHKMEIIRKQ